MGQAGPMAVSGEGGGSSPKGKVLCISRTVIKNSHQDLVSTFFTYIVICYKLLHPPYLKNSVSFQKHMARVRPEFTQDIHGVI